MPREQLKDGYTPDTISANVAILESEGRGPAEARAIAHRKARRSLAARLESGVEVFRAGHYPGKAAVTENDLDLVVQNYNELQAPRGVRYQAAAKHTHKPDMPALGWVSAVSRAGRSLVARFRKPSNDLLDGIIEERFPNPSVELRRDLQVDGKSHGLSLKAIGFMGADPPAVKEVAAFSEDPDTFIVTYNEWNEGGDMPEENKLTIEVKQAEPTPAATPAPAPAAPAATDQATSFSEADLEQAKKEAADTARKEAELKFAEEQAAREKERREAENLAFAEQLVKDGKLAPAKRDFTVALLNGIDPDLKFSEGEDKSEKPVLAEVKAQLAAGDSSTLFAEITPKGESGLPLEHDDDEGKARDAKIKKYAADHNLSYSEAFEATEGGYTFPPA